MNQFWHVLSIIIEQLLLPPGIFVVLMAFMLIPRVRQSKKFISFTFLVTYLLSIPLVGHHLLLSLESIPPITPKEVKESGAQGILILSAGRRKKAEEYELKDIPNSLYFDRLRYGAWLHRKTGLPLFISGGLGKSSHNSLSQLGRDFLEKRWRIPVKDIEKKSQTTWQNALLSEKMLKRYKMNKIVLVTHSWHLPRVVQAFKLTTLQIIPAGTVYLEKYSFEWNDLLPTMSALYQSFYAIHEWLGRAWYQLKNMASPPLPK